tara:strand:- start:397 stop:597 length:201 start_codon:yes stop_codon:yes gene_type:complete
MMRKGSIVYVPSDVTIFTNDNSGQVKKIMKLSRPQTLLVTEVNERTYEVLLDGERWLVDKKKTYEG